MAYRLTLAFALTVVPTTVAAQLSDIGIGVGAGGSRSTTCGATAKATRTRPPPCGHCPAGLAPDARGPCADRAGPGRAATGSGPAGRPDLASHDGADEHIVAERATVKVAHNRDTSHRGKSLWHDWG